MSLGEIAPRIRGTSASPAGGANTQLQYNNQGTLAGTANATLNIASNLISVEANVRMANASNLYFGGSQANTVSNSRFYICWNVTTTSLDFITQNL